MFIYLNIFLMIASLGLIWLGSGLVVSSIDKLSHRLHKSPFLVSFFLLGLLTSITEIAVAVNSHLDGLPEISAGNLLGGIIVLFLLVMPLLGFFGNGIKLNHDVNPKNLLLCIVFLLSPFVFFVDMTLSTPEALIMVVLYFCSAYYLYNSRPKKSREADEQLAVKVNPRRLATSVLIFLQIVIGIVIIVIASDYLLKAIMFVAEEYHVNPFLISLVGLSIGTNFPELSLAIRALVRGKKNIAFGNYLGSASFNPLILAILAIVNKEIYINFNFMRVFTFAVVGLIIFYIFAKSKKTLSRSESLLLLMVYILFVVSENF